ncbi:glucan endo-1,3-alpha-glucosidase agn1 [Penicillium ochrochloron]
MGLPLYGRSFKLVEAGCTGPDCHFTGPLSGATPGICTDTAGYISNYEIFNWLSQDQNSDIYGNISISQYEDEGDVFIFNETDWISWLSPESYVSRREWGDSLNFGGTSDWAVDLNQTYASNGTGSEVDSGYDDDYQLCDYSLTYDSLEELSSAAADMRTDCVGFYTLQVLIKMLDTAYDNYTNVNNGYDEMFTYYVDYMNDLVPQILDTSLMFVGDGGNPDGTESVGAAPVWGEGMNYFDCAFSDGNDYPCGEANNRTDSDNDFAPNGDATRLTLTDPDGWSAKLTDEGIDSSYVEFGDYTRTQYYPSIRGMREYNYKFNNFPIKNESMVVPNPKDIVSQAIPNMPDLRNQMKATLLDIMLGQWINGSTSNAAEAYSSPVFMLMQGVDGMAQAKQIGEDEKKLQDQEAEAKKRDFILTIISVVLIFVPVIGEEAAAAAGLATLARSCAIAGEAGNAGLAIYDTVQNPQSAFVNIIGSLIGVGSVAKVTRDGPGLDAVARIRQGMKATEISDLGKIFKSNSDTMDTIMKVCRIG